MCKQSAVAITIMIFRRKRADDHGSLLLVPLVVIAYEHCYDKSSIATLAGAFSYRPFRAKSYLYQSHDTPATNDYQHAFIVFSHLFRGCRQKIARFDG
jgi:hypothetical protein